MMIKGFLEFIREKVLGYERKVAEKRCMEYLAFNDAHFGSVLKGSKIHKPLDYILKSDADQGTKNAAKRLARTGQGAELQALAQRIANK